jgi:hypothetical protein
MGAETFELPANPARRICVDCHLLRAGLPARIVTGRYTVLRRNVLPIHKTAGGPSL